MTSVTVGRRTFTRIFILIDLMAAGIVAITLAIYRQYSLALGLSVFVALTLGSVFYTVTRGKIRYVRAQEILSNEIEQFRERLAKQGVLDETNDIALAKRFPWVKENNIKQISAFIKDFAETVKIGERIYVIHAETLKRLVDRLPMKDEEIQRLTSSERRVFEIARSANIIAQEETGVWRKV